MEGGLKKKNRSRKKKKINLVFDPEARREFLTGFHKRKVQRKMKFQENLKQMLKDERKKIKQDAKESYKKMVVSHRSVPEVEHLLREEHDLGTHSVEIEELSTNDLAEKNNWIGTNKVKYEVKEEEEEEENNSLSDSEKIPGMDIKRKTNSSVPKAIQGKDIELKTAKDVKRVIKKQATKQVKKSKVFQLKNKVEKQKNKKKSLQQKMRKGKLKESGKKGKRLRKRGSGQNDR